MTHDEDSGLLDAADRRTIGRIVRQELQRLHPSLADEYTYDDDDDGSTPIERRARRNAADRLANDIIDPEISLPDAEVLGIHEWEKAHDAAAHEQCMPDEDPKPATTGAPPPVDDYDYQDPLS